MKARSDTRCRSARTSMTRNRRLSEHSNKHWEQQTRLFRRRLLGFGIGRDLAQIREIVLVHRCQLADPRLGAFGLDRRHIVAAIERGIGGIVTRHALNDIAKIIGYEPKMP